MNLYIIVWTMKSMMFSFKAIWTTFVEYILCLRIFNTRTTLNYVIYYVIFIKYYRFNLVIITLKFKPCFVVSVGITPIDKDVAVWMGRSKFFEFSTYSNKIVLVFQHDRRLPSAPKTIEVVKISFSQGLF